MKNNAKLTILQINDTHGYLDIHQEWFAVPQQPRCITSRAGSPNIRRRDADEPGEEGQPVGQNKAGVIMKGFVQNIEGITVKNEEFRRVLYTAKHCQLVVMALRPKEEIGAEVHKLDEFNQSRGERGCSEAVT